MPLHTKNNTQLYYSTNSRDGFGAPGTMPQIRQAWEDSSGISNYGGPLGKISRNFSKKMATFFPSEMMEW